MEEKSLPDELASEEGIPEALNAFRQALSDPLVLEMIARREKFEAQEKKRHERVSREEWEKAFKEAIKGYLARMKSMGIAPAIIKKLKRKARVKAVNP